MSSFATPGISARTTNSEPSSIRSTSGCRTRSPDSPQRARGPQKRSSTPPLRIVQHALEFGFLTALRAERECHEHANRRSREPAANNVSHREGTDLARRRWLWLRAGPAASPDAGAEQLLDVGRTRDHVDVHRVVARVDDDRPDLQDALGQRLMEVHPLELGVRDHDGVLVQDAVLADDLVTRDDVSRRLPLELG